MENKTFINIELRSWTGSDVTNEYVEAHNNFKAKYYSASGIRKFDKKSLYNAVEEGRLNKTCFYYGIYEKNCCDLIGTIIIQDISSANRTADVVPFIFNEKYFKYKLGASVIKLGCQEAFDNYDVRKIFGGVNRNNVGALKTFLKSDYVIEGVRRAQFGDNDNPSDEILVACFNRRYFSEEYLRQYTITFEDIYG